MRNLILAAAVFTAFNSIALRADDNAAKKAAKEIEGIYTAKFLNRGGKEVTDTDVKAIVIKDGTIEVQLPKENEPAKFKLDPSKSPAHIDIMPVDDKDKGRMGIYKFEKGELTTVSARKGDRPTSFDGKGEDEMKMVLVKKNDKE